MALMFATRAPTQEEIQHIRALLSTFRDGSGNQKDGDGLTRASWREIERCIAEAVNAIATEDKNIFDVVAKDPNSPMTYYGLSIKSKQLSPKAFNTLDSGARVYMEIANSPAKFWADVRETHGYGEREFGEKKHAAEIGNTVIASVKKWHQEGKIQFEKDNPGVVLDLTKSCYVCVSYSEVVNPDHREYRIHAFELDYPENIIWKYKSERCLTGYDPAHPTEALLDWYGSSGGQLKYYPRATTARFSSPAFGVLKPPRQMTLTDKAKIYFPAEFK